MAARDRESPPVRSSTMRPKSSGGSKVASTEAAAQRTVPMLSSLCSLAASNTAANTPLVGLRMVRTSCLTFIEIPVSGIA